MRQMSEFMPHVFFHMMLSMKFQAFGECPGISLVDSTMIPVRHNPGRRFDKVFKDIATDGIGTTGWCHGFKFCRVNWQVQNLEEMFEEPSFRC